MRKVKKHVLKAIEVVARSTVSEWPPFCAGIFHQPKRPAQQKKDK